MKSFIALMQEALASWSRDRAPRISAAMAYYAIFALPPLTLLLIILASLLFESATVQQEFYDLASSLIGRQAAQVLAQFLEETPRPSGDWLSTIIGLGALFFSASALFGQLQDALNSLWGVRIAKQGLKRMVLNRALHLSMVIAVGVVFVLMLVLTTTTAWLVGMLPAALGDSPTITRILDILFTLFFATISFGLVYKVVPNVHIAWRHIFLGSLVTAVLFVLGRFALSLFFRYADPTSAYGAAGSVILLLLWIYYLAQIFFFGAEITQIWAKRQGAPIRPSRGAVRVVSMIHPPGEPAEAHLDGSPEAKAALASIETTQDEEMPRTKPTGTLEGVLSTLGMLLLLALLLIKSGRGDGGVSHRRPANS